MHQATAGFRFDEKPSWHFARERQVLPNRSKSNFDQIIPDTLKRPAEVLKLQTNRQRGAILFGGGRSRSIGLGLLQTSSSAKGASFAFRGPRMPRLRADEALTKCQIITRFDSDRWTNARQKASRLPLRITDRNAVVVVLASEMGAQKIPVSKRKTKVADSESTCGRNSGELSDSHTRISELGRYFQEKIVRKMYSEDCARRDPEMRGGEKVWPFTKYSLSGRSPE
ncbi:hypothetical protein B0H14DRAFT_3713829 [Mycena olivaceomarginata]|nr:hypothetical protein B0H14DRAFT_3713829 [Mycena olivaceomarginata]